MNKVDKKALLALLTGLLVIAFTGCQLMSGPEVDTGETENQALEEESTKEVLPATDKTNDKSEGAEAADPEGYRDPSEEDHVGPTPEEDEL